MLQKLFEDGRIIVNQEKFVEIMNFLKNQKLIIDFHYHLCFLSREKFLIELDSENMFVFYEERGSHDIFEIV